MKTIYLLKNSPKSFRVLLKLVKMGDITTNIIIVDRFYSKILRQDKRVKEFPFIINTLPTARGLIPKIAKVLPYRVYIQIININKNINKNKNININTKNPNNYIRNSFNKRGGRTITYKPELKVKNSIFNSPKITLKKPTIKAIKPTIKAIKQKDKSVNIILYNN
jgi:hypothetical protein